MRPSFAPPLSVQSVACFDIEVAKSGFPFLRLIQKSREFPKAPQAKCKQLPPSVQRSHTARQRLFVFFPPFHLSRFLTFHFELVIILEYRDVIQDYGREGWKGKDVIRGEGVDDAIIQGGIAGE